MGDPGIEPETEKPKATGVLKYGDEGYEVRALQERLVELGYNVGNVDEDFGAGTRAAVLAFQADHNLDTDGIVGDETRDALRDDTNNKPISEARAAATEKALAAAGSQTIKASNKISLIGKVLAFLGISSGVAPVDQITEGVDKVHTLQPYMAALRGVGQWALTHWWIIVILVGLAIYFLAREIIYRRVADHISGANMGR